MLTQFDVGKFGIDVMDRIKKMNEIDLSAEVITLLVLLECKINLELINSIKISANNKVFHNDIDIISVISKLESKYIELLFVSLKNNSKLIKFSNRNYKNICDHWNKKIKKYLSNETAFDTICNLYVKIHTLQKLITLEQKGTALKDIQFKQRLNNIKYRLIALNINLSDKNTWKRLFKTNK